SFSPEAIGVGWGLLTGGNILPGFSFRVPPGSPIMSPVADQDPPHEGAEPRGSDPMKRTTGRVLLLATALLAAATGRAGAGVIITIEQVGGDVVVTGSGSLNTAGLTFISTGIGFSATLDPFFGMALLGPTVLTYDQYSGLGGTFPFGPGSGGDASSG